MLIRSVDHTKVSQIATNSELKTSMIGWRNGLKEIEINATLYREGENQELSCRMRGIWLGNPTCGKYFGIVIDCKLNKSQMCDLSA